LMVATLRRMLLAQVRPFPRYVALPSCLSCHDVLWLGFAYLCLGLDTMDFKTLRCSKSQGWGALLPKCLKWAETLHPKADALKTMLSTDACTALHYVNYLVCLSFH
jgi:hypothetical protein